MDIKRFHEKNMHTALQKIREQLGEDAVIISSNQNTYGVEVVAATDYEAIANDNALSENLRQKEKAVSTRYKKSNSAYQSTIVNEYEKLKKSQGVYREEKLSKKQAIDTTLIEEEISQLRKIIESQTEMISWNRLIHQNVMARKVLQRLSINGFGFSLSKKILNLDKVKHASNFDEVWKLIENILKDKISITQENVIEEGGVVALIGPTGVGKTTTIAKIAAQYAIQNSSSDIAIISTDHYRIGAHDQISIYGSILNVPVIVANNEVELQKALIAVKNKKLVLIDTAGLSQRDVRVKEVMQSLNKISKDLITYLVASANSQLCVQKETINNFKTDSLNGVIVSKTDEASQIGGILTVLMEQNLSIAFVTNGQRVPEDIARLNQAELIIKSLKYGEKFNSMESLHSTELFSELVENVCA